ncbi:MAG: hypothetical protein CM1200mP18_06080 [Gammaproteobacteria bacterium]|nr:MAG: hypothetical protein CM1200mP18_06080 [Gammaproteobacteria bacterium]
MLQSADPAELESGWNLLEEQADQQLAIDGFLPDQRDCRSANMHYQGQIYELSVPVLDGPFGARNLASLQDAFGDEHERTYGHRAGPDEPVELVNIELVGQGLSQGSRVPEGLHAAQNTKVEVESRQAYFGREHRWMETPVIAREALSTAHPGAVYH